MITLEAGHFRSHGDGEPPDGSITEMFGATFSGPRGELFTVLVDPRPDRFVIQLDEPEKGPSFEVAEARADTCCCPSRATMKAPSRRSASSPVDVWWTSRAQRTTAPGSPNPLAAWDSSAWIRTRDLTIMSRAL